VEVWRRTDAKVSQLFDASGKLIETSRTATPPVALNPGNAWQFEPSADAYRALAGNPGSILVSTDVDMIRLESQPAHLVQIDFWVDKTSYRPVRESIQTPNDEFEFREAGIETVPDSASPFKESSRPSGKPASDRGAASLPFAVPDTVSETDLDE